MTWTVYSRTDNSRWLNFASIDDWVADVDTTRRLTGPDVAVKLGPLGPYQVGVETEAKLFAAAMALVPASRSAGSTPSLPDPGAVPERAVS
ncbi:MAG: hypothetical protein WBD41_14265 [Rhodococcus sp. (in: high G+C Gram-positive bacteria)]